ncbi:MAG: HD domain-containing phosphohydrolase [Rhodocyclaceae bacterium]|nr:HD domain-containing phosphohydrolase [Rhodocyclaceae bacterium]
MNAAPPDAAKTRGVSITSALIFNIATLTLAIGALCAWLITQWGTQEIFRHESNRLDGVARSVAQQISLELDERYADVRSVRDLFEQELSAAPAAQRRQVMERVRAGYKRFSWLGVVATDGTVGVGTGGLLEGASVAGRNWFEGALTQPAFFGNVHPAKLLEPYIKNPDGAPLYLLDIALPLHRADGRVIGVVGSHLNWRMIEDVVKQTLGETSADAKRLAAAVVAQDGTILYDTEGVSGNVGASPNMPGAERMIEADWPSESEKSFLVSVPMPPYRSLMSVDWRVQVREPASAVGAGVTRMKWQVIGTSLLVGLIFSLLGLFALRSVTRPIQALVRDMTRFGETESLLPGEHIAEPIVEIGNLRSSFQSMAANVMAQKNLLEETQFEIVRTLARAGEFRDNETGNHVSRMSLCCGRLAELAQLGQARCEMLLIASKMHDIGKIGIPDHVLLKPGRFDDAERAIIERHCSIGARILGGVETPLTVMARTIALSHHEKWDGSGYPHRLAGNDIPIEGRIASICDVFDALLSSRPYKQGWPLDKVEAFMAEQAGHHFDPWLVKLFLDHLQDFVAIRARFRDEPAEETSGTPDASARPTP